MRSVQCFALALASLLAPAVQAEATPGTTDLSARLPATLKLNYEQLKLPANEKMGVLGTSYLLELAPGLQLGPAVYGSITGQRGGFYTIGAEAAWRQPLVAGLEMDTGLYVGGGGGGPAMVGGGLMVRPHLDLVWDFSGIRAGISASSVRFPSGTIRSNQFGVVLSADTDFVYTPVDHAGETTSIDHREGIGFDRAIATVGAYRPSRGAVSNTIGYAGARFEHFFDRNLYWGIEAAGAASGNASGYAEFLGSLGAETALGDGPVSVGARLAAGMGGGSSGLIQVGGGQLDKAAGYVTARLGRDVSLLLEGGYAVSPGGQFRAKYGTAGLVFDLDHPYGGTGSATVDLNEWVLGSEHYFNVRHQNGTADTLNAITLKHNYYLDRHFYLTGQAHSAYGGNSGGYSVGLFGLGYRSPRTASGLYAGADLLVGAAGGGFVDTRGGAVTQPMAYVGLELNRVVSLKLSAGHIKSFKGALSSNVLDAAIDIAFGNAGR